jgi:hypothetical protein
MMDNGLQETIACQADLLRLLRGQLAAALAELATAREVIDRDTVLIRDQAAAIAMFRAAAAFKAPDPVKAPPAPNPFRQFRRDRRLMGP